MKKVVLPALFLLVSCNSNVNALLEKEPSFILTADTGTPAQVTVCTKYLLVYDAFKETESHAMLKIKVGSRSDGKGGNRIEGRPQNDDTQTIFLLDITPEENGTKAVLRTNGFEQFTADDIADMILPNLKNCSSGPNKTLNDALTGS